MEMSQTALSAQIRSYDSVMEIHICLKLNFVSENMTMAADWNRICWLDSTAMQSASITCRCEAISWSCLDGNGHLFPLAQTRLSVQSKIYFNYCNFKNCRRYTRYPNNYAIYIYLLLVIYKNMWFYNISEDISRSLSQSTLT